MDSKKNENDVLYLDIDESAVLTMNEESECENIKSWETEEERKKLNEIIFGTEEQVAHISSTQPYRRTTQDKVQMDSRSIFVGNVDYGTRTEELERHFKGCGPIKKITIPCDKFKGNAKGFAYIEFADADSVNLAMAMGDSLLRGRKIKVATKRTNIRGMSSTNRCPARGMRGKMVGSSRVPFKPWQPQGTQGYRGRPSALSFRGRTWVRPT